MRASLLICFISSGCPLPDSPPPFLPPSICQTDSCWPTPSVVVRSVQSLPDSTSSPQFLHLLPNMLLYYFTSLLSSPTSRPRHPPGRTSAIYSGGQKVKKVVRVGYMRTSVTSACNQSLFGLLHLLLAMCLCLSCRRLELNDTSEDPE